jgi:hypothetical protein
MGGIFGWTTIDQTNTNDATFVAYTDNQDPVLQLSNQDASFNGLYSWYGVDIDQENLNKVTITDVGLPSMPVTQSNTQVADFNDDTIISQANTNEADITEAKSVLQQNTQNANANVGLILGGISQESNNYVDAHGAVIVSEIDTQNANANQWSDVMQSSDNTAYVGYTDVYKTNTQTANNNLNSLISQTATNPGSDIE